MMPDAPCPILLLYTGCLDVGGVEAHLLSLLRGDRTGAYRWLVCATMSPRFQEALEAAGGVAIPWAAHGRLDLAAIRRLREIIHAHGVRLVHVHDSRALLLGGLAARMEHLPVLQTVHMPAYFYDGIRGHRIKEGLYRLSERLTIRALVGHTIFVASNVYQDALASGVARATEAEVIENGIDLAQVRAAARRGPQPPLPAVDGMPCLLFAGRLTTQKGVDVLLQAVAILQKRAIAFHVLIAGDGPLRDTLAATAAATGLTGQITWLGMRTDIPALLNAADIFVLPSRYEGLSIGLLEALAVGVPCVVTDVNENALVVRQGIEGLVVPADDPERLAEALAALLLDAEQRVRMAAAAALRAEAYSLDRMCTRLFRCYHDLLSTTTGEARA